MAFVYLDIVTRHIRLMTNDIVLCGITTCETVRKARKWLEGQGIAFVYHDLRKDGLSEPDLTAWVKAVVGRPCSTVQARLFANCPMLTNR